uniref:ADP,ATP carrier protein n=1 Tax=Syphacia muris TaxID=451379 RepID=A0A0N5AXK8_9BILA
MISVFYIVLPTMFAEYLTMSFLKSPVAATSSSTVYGSSGSKSRISIDATESGSVNATGLQSPSNETQNRTERVCSNKFQKNFVIIAFNAISGGVYGGLFGVFGRGFFAKPINHSKEESYRYLMALDQ